MQELIVALCVLIAAGFVFKRYAPRSWHRALLRLGAASAGVVGWKKGAINMNRLATQNVTAGGCGSCASSESKPGAPAGTFSFSADDLARSLPSRKRVNRR